MIRFVPTVDLIDLTETTLSPGELERGDSLVRLDTVRSSKELEVIQDEMTEQEREKAFEEMKLQPNTKFFQDNKPPNNPLSDLKINYQRIPDVDMLNATRNAYYLEYLLSTQKYKEDVQNGLTSNQPKRINLKKFQKYAWVLQKIEFKRGNDEFELYVEFFKINEKIYASLYQSKRNNRVVFEYFAGQPNDTFECKEKYASVIDNRIVATIYENKDGGNQEKAFTGTFDKVSFNPYDHKLENNEGWNMYLEFVYINSIRNLNGNCDKIKGLCVPLCTGVLIGIQSYFNFIKPEERLVRGSVWLASTNVMSAFNCYKKAFELSGFDFYGNFRNTSFYGFNQALAYKKGDEVYFKIPGALRTQDDKRPTLVNNDIKLLRRKKTKFINYETANKIKETLAHFLILAIRKYDLQMRHTPGKKTKVPTVAEIKKFLKNLKEEKYVKRYHGANNKTPFEFFVERFNYLSDGTVNIDVNGVLTSSAKATKAKKFIQMLDLIVNDFYNEIYEDFMKKKEIDLPEGGFWTLYNPRVDAGFIYDTEDDRDKAINGTFIVNEVQNLDEKVVDYQRSYPGHYSIHMGFEKSDRLDLNLKVL